MKLRDMVVAKDGNVLVSCDLSQAETWIVAFLAREDNMKHALMFDDIHATTAKAIFEIPSNDSPKAMYKRGEITTEQRYTGKKTNHASSYMMKEVRFAESYNEEADTPISVATAKKYQDNWHKLYPGVRNWWSATEYELKSNNGMLVTPYDRRITFFGPISSYIKDAVAAKPQSTVADHFRGRVQKFNPIPGGLKEIDRRLPKEALIVQQGHDSAVIECPKVIGMDVAYIMKECLLRPIIINGEECTIPVDGEIGESWGQLEKIQWN